MRETIGSLKAYFILVAVLGLIGSFGLLTSTEAEVLFSIIGLIGLTFSAIYLYIGISLRKLLVNSPDWIINVLVANIIYQVITFLLSLMDGFSIGLVVRLAIGLLILLYLLVNVKRLSKEEALKLQHQSQSEG